MKRTAKNRNSEIKRLKAMADKAIDTSDIPEVVDWSIAETGRFYRPVKQSVTLRLDADLVVWLKAKNEKYQTAVNRILREYMLSHR